MPLECVVNLSEGTDRALLQSVAEIAGDAVLDLHSDAHHNRSVLTLASRDTGALIDATEALVTAALSRVDLTQHVGVHPRLGVVDVVPFAPIGEPPFDLTEAVAARNTFAAYAASTLGLPCFYYGPERTLPEIRRRAFRDLAPDLGPAHADPRRGACCVGARRPLVAYNLILAEPDLLLAKKIANALRNEQLRALGFVTGDEVQISCNLIEPFSFGPAELKDAVSRYAPVARTELVGLIPAGVLTVISPARWAELDLAADKTVEARLERAKRRR